MFLPNLQKNIQELERQISRLETECEHMGKRESGPVVKESTNQPFITGPGVSMTTYSTKAFLLADPRQVPKSPTDPQNPPVNDSPKPPRKRSKTSFSDLKGEPRSNNAPRSPHEKKNPDPTGDPKRCRRPTQPPKPTSESSDENQLPHRIIVKLANKLREAPKEAMWCELLGENFGAKNHQKNKQKESKEVLTARKDPNASSGEEHCRSARRIAGEKGPGEGETVEAPRSKRRSRSARTQKNHIRDDSEDPVPPKTLKEKETQCLLWDDEKGKGEYFLSVNESVRVLHGLIEELKKKPSQEKRNDVLNDMQNTLKKITEMKKVGPLTLPQPQTLLPVKSPEIVENVVNLKHALFAMKKVCDELSSEKSALAEEISVKNVAIANFKAKEKEYLTLISGLRYNLEKQKEAAEEGTQAKRDLKILTVKLQEETKVIEALKKSHAKMQELVENYVLENDRLKAHVKITKLETQKYNVLLAGKDAEISKYKREIESFQKHITEQLSLLRSKATEKEVQRTIDAISNQASILKQDEATGQQEDDETAESSSTRTQITCRRRSPPPCSRSSGLRCDREGQPCCGGHKRPSEPGFAPRTPRLDPSAVLADSHSLRHSINELLEDINRESSEVYWLSTANSYATCGRSGTTSEEVSDASHRD